ncbi:MAG: flagellin [Planctomycetota bacterium]
MSLRINHNIAAVNGHRNMLNNDKAISKSLEKLSSGLRINRAADDAAGLIISEQMRAQITGLDQAVDNAESAISMVQTAEGALDEVNTLLNKARELALHAANEGANDTNQLIADQSELDNIIESVNRIAGNTQFGTKKLLDGSLSTASSNNSSVSSVKLGGDYTTLLNAGSVEKGYHTLEVTATASQATNVMAMASASDVFTGGTLAAASGSEVVQKSFTVSVNGAELSVSSGTTKNQFIQQLNAVGDKVGFTATVTGAGGVGDITLTAKDYGTSFDFDVQFVSGASGASNLANTETAGTASTATLYLYSGDNGVGGTALTGATQTISFSSANDGGAGLRMTSAGGSSIALSTAAATGTIAGAIDGTAGGATFQIGANVNQTATVALGSTSANQLGVGGSGVYTDLGQLKGSALVSGNAQEALKVIDVAIDDITNARGELGAFQANTLESTVSSLRIGIENLTSAESTIRDVDFAAESATFTRNNIMIQAATSMLAQANQLPQNVLQLLG